MLGLQVSTELNFMPLPNCLELFGLDFMLTADNRVWFLEANAEPDFKQTGGRLRDLVKDVVRALVIEQILLI